jgi:hypothetical protein
MREEDRGVQRADHNPEAARKAARGERLEDGTRVDSADRHGHGAHGKGRNEEQLNDDPALEPGADTGSVVDKRDR